MSDKYDRVTRTIVETVRAADPEYRFTSHVGPDDVHYLMIEIPPAAGEYTGEAPTEFVRMVSERGAAADGDAQ